MERRFDDELRVLKETLLKMGSLVEQVVSDSIKALVDREPKFAEEVILADDRINMMEIEIDEMCLRLLALRHPEARDLRFITSTMRANSDLERMGDLAVNIAERTLDLLKEPVLKPLIDIPQMAKTAQGMLKDSLDSFVNRDSKLARSVCQRDDVVDQLNDQIFRELLTHMIGDPKTINRALQLILIARNLERVADHSTNICEDVIFMVEGRNIKHHIEERVRK